MTEVIMVMTRSSWTPNVGWVKRESFEVVKVGGQHACQLRRVWLKMLADAPGAFPEPLDEAMAMTDRQWTQRAKAFERSGTVAMAAQTPDGRFVCFAAGYLDHEDEERVGQLSYWYPGDAAAASARVPSMLMAHMVLWMQERQVNDVYVALREDQDRTLAQLADMGFAPTGARRGSIDPEYDEVELVCHLWNPLFVEALYASMSADGPMIR